MLVALLSQKMSGLLKSLSKIIPMSRMLPVVLHQQPPLDWVACSKHEPQISLLSCSLIFILKFLLCVFHKQNNALNPLFAFLFKFREKSPTFLSLSVPPKQLIAFDCNVIHPTKFPKWQIHHAFPAEQWEILLFFSFFTCITVLLLKISLEQHLQDEWNWKWIEKLSHTEEPHAKSRGVA